MAKHDLETWLSKSYDDDPAVRRRVVSQLCPCHIKLNDARIWDRLLEMAHDPDPRVRSWIVHNLCDGSPRSRESEIVEALESLRNDADKGLRRRVRKVLAIYRRTGRINVM